MAAVYLYTGPENGEKNDAVKKLRDALKKKFGEIEEYNYYASETPVKDFMGILENESLFANAVCVTVKNAEILKKKEDIETITKWIFSSTSETNVLILTSDEISIDTKIEKAIPAANKKYLGNVRKPKSSVGSEFFPKKWIFNSGRSCRRHS